MTKRLICVFLAVIMLLGTMAACSKQPPVDTTPSTSTPKPTDGPSEPVDDDKVWFGTEDGKTVTLRFWGGIQPEYGYDKIVENFNAEYADKGLQVEYVRYVNNSDGNLQLETQLMAGDGIDVFVGYGDKVKLMGRADSGLMYDYSDYLESVGFDVAKELGENAAVDCVQEDGSIWGLPTKFDNNGWIMINKDAFEAANIPIPYEGWTYAEFKDACEKLTSGEGQDKKYGICWGFNFSNSQALVYASAVLGIDQYFTDETMTKANLDNPVWIEGLDLIKTTMDNGWAMPLEDDIADQATVQTVFLTEKCAIFGIFSQLRLCMDTENYPHDFVTALVPFPVPSEEYADKKDMAEKAYSGDFISVAAKTKYPEAAAEFARWYIQGGMNPLILGARYPLWTGADSADILAVVEETANGTIDLESLNHLFSTDRSAFRKPVYVSDLNGPIKTIIWEEWQKCLYGQLSSEEAMQNAQKRAQEEIDKAAKS